MIDKELLQDLENIRKIYQDKDLTDEQKKVLNNGINLWILEINIKAYESSLSKHEEKNQDNKLQYLKKTEKRLYNRLLRWLKEKTRNQSFFDEKLVVSPLDKKNIISYQYNEQFTLNYPVLMRLCKILQNEENIKIIKDYFTIFNEFDDTSKDVFLTLQIINFLEENYMDVQKYYNIRHDINNLPEIYFNMKEYENIKRECEKYEKMNVIEKKFYQKKIKILLLKLTNLEKLYSQYQEKEMKKREMNKDLEKIKKKLEEKGWFDLISDIPRNRVYQYISLFENNQFESFKSDLEDTIIKQKKLKIEKMDYIKEYSLDPYMIDLLQNNEKLANLIRKMANDKYICILLFILKGFHDLKNLSFDDIKDILNQKSIENYELEVGQFIENEKIKIKQICS